MGFRAYLLDIEGTTTPLDFVSRTLFPYARDRMEAFLAEADFESDPELAVALESLRTEHAADVAFGHNPPPIETKTGSPPARGGSVSEANRGGRSPEAPAQTPPSSLHSYLLWLMDRDRKSPGLKTIQGKIWETGYRAGDLRGELYPDVVPAIRKWRDSEARVFIYSSGSVLAQRLLFEHSVEGDLTPLLDGYFDTAIGPKKDSESYAAIARAIGIEPRSILFLSDAEAEVSAARAAGLTACRVTRDGAADGWPSSIEDFKSLR